MTADQALVALGCAMAGGLLARAATRPRLARPPQALVRVNVHGRPVPAVLGEGLWMGALVPAGLLVVVRAFDQEAPGFPRLVAAVAAIVVLLGAAGRWDDLRGDERPRGFTGHLGAARGGRLTGGLVKLVAGGVAGLLAGWLVFSGVAAVIETGALVALSANLLNLLDRAPGRAGKIAIVLGAAAVLFGSVWWTLAAAGMAGAVVACLPLDLSARAMLGDAGANPVGGVLGLGVAMSLDEPGRIVAIVVLVGLNALSERYSFSRAIEATPLLRRLDSLGRKPAEPDDRDPK